MKLRTAGTPDSSYTYVVEHLLSVTPREVEMPDSLVHVAGVAMVEPAAESEPCMCRGARISSLGKFQEGGYLHEKFS